MVTANPLCPHCKRDLCDAQAEIDGSPLAPEFRNHYRCMGCGAVVRIVPKGVTLVSLPLGVGP